MKHPIWEINFIKNAQKKCFPKKFPSDLVTKVVNLFVFCKDFIKKNQLKLMVLKLDQETWLNAGLIEITL